MGNSSSSPESSDKLESGFPVEEDHGLVRLKSLVLFFMRRAKESVFFVLTSWLVSESSVVQARAFLLRC